MVAGTLRWKNGCQEHNKLYTQTAVLSWSLPYDHQSGLIVRFFTSPLEGKWRNETTLC